MFDHSIFANNLLEKIALLTMGFLPGTAFAAILSMPFFAQSKWMTHAQRIWLWVALTVPSTLLVGIFYIFYSHRSKLKQNQAGSNGITFALEHFDSDEDFS